MRAILVQGLVYVPTLGGANKSNRLLLEGLTARGHQCVAIAPSCGAHGCRDRAAFHKELNARQAPLLDSTATEDVFMLNGVKIHAAAHRQAILSILRREVHERCPDWIIVSSEDPGQAILRAALDLAPRQVIYLARTTLTLPFGPASPLQAPERTRLLADARSVVSVSDYLSEYISRWSGISATTLPISLHDPGPYPRHGDSRSGDILMINPCAYKGLAIFSEVATAFPGLPFAAVPSWGTTDADLAALSGRSNVRLIEATENIDEIFSQTRVLLVPSLWAEARARVITEALLRGIPVLASDVGGNGEAMVGMDYLLPVAPIERFGSPLRLDARMLPIAEIPAQDVRPWCDALHGLLATPASYDRVSTQSRAAASAANDSRTIAAFETHLEHLITNAPKHQPDRTADSDFPPGNRGATMRPPFAIP
jgi:glycosyltransferase involved in cell wall biosynthesis